MADSAVLQLLGGLVLLLVGAEALVRGASRLAAALHIPPLVVGLTVVAFGTSSPELAASVTSARAGGSELALGNVVGSNIFNVLFILGLAALITPLAVEAKLVRFDLPVLIGSALLVVLLGADGMVSRGDGVLLAVLLVVYLLALVWQARKDREDTAIQATPIVGVPGRLPWAALAALAGLAMLTLGARWLVAGASTLARTFGVGDLVIGLTVVAAGTSLPEVATSVVASLRGERDLAVGNVVGSNIFNALAVLGLAAALSPKGVAVSEAARSFDLLILLAVSVACLPVLSSRLEIDRWEGLLFLVAYGGYLALLLSAASRGSVPSPTLLVVILLAGVAGRTVWQVLPMGKRSPGGGRG